MLGLENTTTCLSQLKDSPLELACVVDGSLVCAICVQLAPPSPELKTATPSEPAAAPSPTVAQPCRRSTKTRPVIEPSGRVPEASDQVRPPSKVRITR